jgi:hypothetical protein
VRSTRCPAQTLRRAGRAWHSQNRYDRDRSSKDDEGVTTESCAQCRAPLADDQRYCLQCGEPRPHLAGPLLGTSVDERPSQPPTGGSTQPAPPTPPVIAAVGVSSRNNSLALIAGVGVLLLAMGVGVLIGRAGAGSAKAPPTQVISLGGAGATDSPTTVAPTTTTPETPAAPAKEKARKAKETAAPSSITKPAPPSSAANLRSGGSGQSFEQKSKNLPNVVSTG